MAVDAVFGTEPAWFAEVDEAPARVLAYRHPTVPNLGDVTRVNWEEAPRVNVLAGGFPCQDVSIAGARRGLKDGTRSGLWSEFAKAIDVLRPDWVVIENVIGLLSAEAHSDVEPCPWCLGDDPGEPALRALGAVLGDLADLGFDAEWTGIRASDVGAPHGRFRVFILAWPAENTRHGLGWPAESRQGGRDDAAVGPGRGGSRGGHDPRLTLLPTPRTTDMNGPGSHGDGGIDLRTAVSLMPTPTATDSKASGGSVPANKTLNDAIVRTGEVLLPTPTVGNATGGNAQRGGASGKERLLPGLAVDAAEGRLMPTPRASRGGSATETMYAIGAERVDDERPQGQVVGDITDWGPYTAAIRHWEAVIGRPAPAPVRHDGKGGKPRLNPELPEWMMGWPAGWVTDPAIGLSRAQQLKAAGNGVVPQQAAAALVEMLARPGVPAVRQEVAA